MCIRQQSMFSFIVLLMSTFIPMTLSMTCPLDQYSVNGTCIDCPTGYSGVNCSSVCKPEYYGSTCNMLCKCSSDQICDHKIGCIEAPTPNKTCEEINCVDKCSNRSQYISCGDCICPISANETGMPTVPVLNLNLRLVYMFAGIGLLTGTVINFLVCYFCKRRSLNSRNSDGTRGEQDDENGGVPQDQIEGVHGDALRIENMGNDYAVSNMFEYNVLSFSTGRRCQDRMNVLVPDFQYEDIAIGNSNENSNKETLQKNNASQFRPGSNDYQNMPMGSESMNSIYSVVQNISSSPTEKENIW